MMSGADLALRIKFDGSAVAPGLNRMKEDIRSTAAGISAIFRSMVAPIAASISAAAGLQQLVAVTREFDKLSAGLITATGSAAGAKEAFAAIQNFAATTPYDLAQTTESFTKLVNFGLTPSERAMRSYGNTASSLGKDLNQMIEAVADAATGEFERLKEFGIKASKEGDKVKFTFRGVKTEIGNNAKEIEDYLIKLGENNFGDAMANRMATLDGAISNIGDAWDTLLRTVSGKGIGNAIADAVREGTAALDELTAKIDSGELDGYLAASSIAWAGWGSDIQKAIKDVGALFDGEMEKIGRKGTTAGEFLSDAFTQFPENVRALVGIAAVELISKFDEWKERALFLKDSFKAIFTDDTIDAAGKRMDQQLKNIATAREETISDILRERDTTIKSTEEKIAASKKLREEYDKNKAAEKADKKDKLEKFKFKPGDEKNAKSASKDFSDKATSQFIEKDGQLVEVPSSEQSTPKTDDEKAKQQADYKKQLAEKRKVLTAEEFKARQAEWKAIEDERSLTKEEEKKKKAEEAKFKKEEAERTKLAKDKEREEKKAKASEKNKGGGTAGDGAGDGYEYIPSRLADDRSGAAAERKKASDAAAQAEEDAAAKKIADDLAAKKEAKEKEEQVDEQARAAQDAKNQAHADKKKQLEAKGLDDAKQAAAEIEKANAKRLDEAKQAAEEWAATEAAAVKKAESRFQQYYNQLAKIEGDIAGRRKSLSAELADLDPNADEETKWRRKAAAAKEYELAAKKAMQSGKLDEALSLADEAKKAYSGLRGGAGGVSADVAQRATFGGVKSSGEMGIAIEKLMAAKTGEKIRVDLGAAGSQLAAAAGQTAQGTEKTVPGGAVTTPSKIVEVRFDGGNVQGSEASVNALLKHLEMAGGMA